MKVDSEGGPDREDPALGIGGTEDNPDEGDDDIGGGNDEELPEIDDDLDDSLYPGL